MTAFPSRIPPHNLDAERALLGGALLDPATADLVVSTPAEAFYTEAHRDIAQAIARLVRAGQPVDPLTLIDDLRRAGQLEMVGGPSAIALIEEHASIRVHAPAYLGMVRECAARRELIQTADLIRSEAFEESGREASAIIGTALTRLVRVQGGDVELVTGADLFLAPLSEADTSIPTNFPIVDDCADGLTPGHLFVVAGRPSIGKTAWAVQLAHRLVTIEKVPTLFLSLEMSEPEIVARLLCLETRVGARLIRTKTAPDPGVIDLARRRMSSYPLHIQRRRVRGLDDVLALIRTAVVLKSVRVVILDHLGKITGRRRDNRYLETSEVAEELKATAFQLNVPVVALCQLNRAVEARNSPKPRLSDLRDSGRIEEEADEILFLWTEDERLTADPRPVTLSLEKVRNGPTGDEDYSFNRSRGLFTPQPKKR